MIEQVVIRKAGVGALHPERYYTVVVKTSLDEANFFLAEHLDWGLLNEVNGEFILSRLDDDGFSRRFFIVIDEALFGVVNPLSPNQMQVLRDLSGANRSTEIIALGAWITSPLAIRPARRADFDHFRILHQGYQRDSARYHFPSE